MKNLLSSFFDPLPTWLLIASRVRPVLFCCRIIVGKIDKDGDGQVTEQELKDWIQYVQKRYIVTDTDRMWKDHDVQGDKLLWSAYKKRTYGSDDGTLFLYLN